MNLFVADIPPFVENLPDTYLSLNPLLRSHTVEMVLRAVAEPSI
jgi:hypothetical protein